VNGVEGSFEYYCDGIFQYLRETWIGFKPWEIIRLLTYRYAISFVTHFSSDDRYLASVAAATLAADSGGLLLDAQTGRFVQSSLAEAWAARIKPPSSEELTRRKALRDEAAAFLGDNLSELGYQCGPSFDPSECVFWFTRTGEIFTTEMIEASVCSDEAGSTLTICYFGSQDDLHELHESGLEGRVAGRYLFQVTQYSEKGDFIDPLPQAIPLSAGFAASDVARKLLTELVRVDAIVFSELDAACGG
jgi:hypothetical protein